MQVFFLPSVALPRNLPPRSGIYYITGAWVIFYVGKSKNLRERWRSHHKLSEFNALHPFGRIHYYLVPVNCLQEWERREIKRLCPPWNNQNSLTWGEKLWLKVTTGLRMAVIVSLAGIALGAIGQGLIFSK